MAECGKFNHLRITVKDMKKTEKFYGEVLGFKVIDRLSGLDCPDYAAGTGVENAVLDVLLMEGHGLVIEFIRFVSPGGEPVEYMPNNPGAAHICFETDDAEGMYKKIKDSGMTMLAPCAATISYGPHEGNTVWYFRDPNGYPVEFLTLKK